MICKSKVIIRPDFKWKLSLSLKITFALDLVDTSLAELQTTKKAVLIKNKYSQLKLKLHVTGLRINSVSLLGTFIFLGIGECKCIYIYIHKMYMRWMCVDELCMSVLSLWAHLSTHDN